MTGACRYRVRNGFVVEKDGEGFACWGRWVRVDGMQEVRHTEGLAGHYLESGADRGRRDAEG